MANIARFNPFDDAFDDLFRGYLVRPLSYENPAGAAQIRVDVTENDNAYTLRAEIPGVKKDDIQITIDGDTVAISAEVKNEKDVKNGDRVMKPPAVPEEEPSVFQPSRNGQAKDWE